MDIAIGSDHHGVSLRFRIASLLRRLGHEPLDFGPPESSTDPVDYPDVAIDVARRVGSGEVERGILICGTGIGMAIAANKFHGVRAAPVVDELSAEISRRHNDLNVLCLSADNASEDLIERLVTTWLSTPFDGGRHQRRVEKIANLETGGCCRKADSSQT